MWRTQTYATERNKLSQQEQEVIDNEIDKLLIKGVMSETTHCSGEYISTGSHRPINLLTFLAADIHGKNSNSLVQ